MTILKRAALPVAALALLSLTAACGGDDSGTTTDAPAVTTVAAGATTTDAIGTTDKGAGTTMAPDLTIGEPDESAAPDDTDAENESSGSDATIGDPSGPAVESGGFGTAELADGEAPAERTILIGDDGFSPDELTIGVGENVTFKVGPDGGIFAVLVGDLDGATVTGGLIETFEFPEAGVYPVAEDLTGATATITVE